MPDGAVYGKHLTRAATQNYLERVGGSGSKLPLLLYPHMWEDTCWMFDDFLVDSLNLDRLITNGGTGATAFAVPATPLSGGAVRAATGTDATKTNRVINMYGSPVWLGDNNCGMEARLKVSDDADIIWECGFINTQTTLTTATPTVTDVDTPATGNGAGDVAVLVQDLAQTLTTIAYVTDGSTTNMNATKTDLGTETIGDDVYKTVRVQLAGDVSVGALYDANGGLLQFANHGVLIGARIEGGVLVRPWFFVNGNTTTTRTFDLDYLATWMDRYARPS